MLIYVLKNSNEPRKSLVKLAMAVISAFSRKKSGYILVI